MHFLVSSHYVLKYLFCACMYVGLCFLMNQMHVLQQTSTTCVVDYGLGPHTFSCDPPSNSLPPSFSTHPSSTLPPSLDPTSSPLPSPSLPPSLDPTSSTHPSPSLGPTSSPLPSPSLLQLPPTPTSSPHSEILEEPEGVSFSDISGEINQAMFGTQAYVKFTVAGIAIAYILV